MQKYYNHGWSAPVPSTSMRDGARLSFVLSMSVHDGTRLSTHLLRPRAQHPSSLLINVRWCPSLPRLIHVYARRRPSHPHLGATAPVFPLLIHVKCDSCLVHTSSTSMCNGALLIHVYARGRPSHPHLTHFYTRRRPSHPHLCTMAPTRLIHGYAQRRLSHPRLVHVYAQWRPLGFIHVYA
jgi:hypothetical protein